MTTLRGDVDQPNWWSSLKHGGLLIAPSKLMECFPYGTFPLRRDKTEALRRSVTLARAGGSDATSRLLDTVFDEVLGLSPDGWKKGNAVDASWGHKMANGRSVKPRRIWMAPNGWTFPVFVTEDSQRLGIGRGRREISLVVEWLRRTGRLIALITNGVQWRLIHAGSDYEAWCEWDVEFWFESGNPAPQLDALRILLGSDSLTAAEPDELPALVQAILASRQGQAELSTLLGERVRQAVELTIRESAGTLRDLDNDAETRRAIYVAATRVVMRCVVVLFAEARDLLPRDNPIYHGSYGIQGLREQLDRQAGGRGHERLRDRCSAWPRMLSLFRLVYEGSDHEALPVLRYGGGLFVPGDRNSKDLILKALGAFEDTRNTPADATVHRILELLCRSKVKVRQGRGSIWVEAPVDFSDLSSEYIGILYEGLLDYELRRTEADESILFVNVGDQPALPLSRLEQMDDKTLSSLVEKFKKSRKLDGEDAEENDDEEEPLEDEESEEEPEVPIEVIPDQDVDDGDEARLCRERAHAWAIRAVMAGKLVAKPRGRLTAESQARYEQAVEAAAHALVTRIVLPGDWFLVRWGGTRKGAGTFYTRPQLAVPTTRRTLQPLAYDPLRKEIDQRSGLEIIREWAPKLPEEILSLKVCDPAMGSGSFLVAALRFLTQALYESLYHHGRIEAHGESALCRLADGKDTNSLLEETLPVSPDDPDFEERLKARLKRYVVERCLYGVDLDPLAVELGQMALWIETMDRELPFEFLDHKLKCGNSLVGCWFDRFLDYPVLAWNREGGDKEHRNGTHFERAAWTNAIKSKREAVKSDMARLLGQPELFAENKAAQFALETREKALKDVEYVHSLSIGDEDTRSQAYKDLFHGSQAIMRLRRDLDTWCAIWFWPSDKLADAPMPLSQFKPVSETNLIVEDIARVHRFFHWELEFPDVFRSNGSGFDAVVGNPPWETQKPNSKEFFSNHDPLYRSYGKQEAIGKQRELFTETSEIEKEWLEYSSRFKALSNWTKNAARPFGDPEEVGENFSFTRSSTRNLASHATWQERRKNRKGYADPAHPFRHQGSADINTYKMFLEISHALVSTSGRIGMIVPSAVYTDKGSTELRELFLKHCRWEWLFGFENRDAIFDIHRSFKFCPIIVQKGGETKAIRTAFMRRSLHDWEVGDKFAIAYPREQVELFSPAFKAILELQSQRDLEAIERLYSNSILLGDEGPDSWGIKYRTEFHMTNDSKLFPPRLQWESQGLRPDAYGRWLQWSRSVQEAPIAGEVGWVPLLGAGWVPESDVVEVALPVYEGRMVGQFDFSQKGWVSGKGRTAVWREIPWQAKALEPQFLMSADDYAGAKDKDGLPKARRGIKVGYMDVASATNSRTMIATLVADMPCGNKVPVLSTRIPARVPVLCAVLNSFVYDYCLRQRLGGLTINYFILAETPVPRLTGDGETIADLVSTLTLRLGATHCSFSLVLDQLPRVARAWADRRWWALTPHERTRLRCILDAVVAELFGLDYDDLSWILRDCDRPINVLRDNAFSRRLDPKGFWRVDKEKDPALRHTVLSLMAFHSLKEMGLRAFVEQNDGEGWFLPEKLCLTDYGFGHDEQAREHQPVASRLGPRFLPWQLELSSEESWEECERHAENLRRLLGEPEKRTPSSTEGTASNLFGGPVATDLFGNALPVRKGKIG